MPETEDLNMKSSKVGLKVMGWDDLGAFSSAQAIDLRKRKHWESSFLLRQCWSSIPLIGGDA